MEQPIKQTLYCIAVEVFNKKNGLVKTSLEYLHADDVANARFKFRLTAPDTQKIRIVSIAQVIGYHADSSGSKLSV